MLSRNDFRDLLQMIRTSDTVVADVEANGLHPWGGSRMIGLSLYLPKYDKNVYLPFRHGLGSLDIETEGGLSFAEMTWQGDAKKNLYLKHWWDKYQAETDFENLPAAWEDELKKVLFTVNQTVIFHNAMYDLAMLTAEGYRTPSTIKDTLLGLHLVHEDMGGIMVSAPYTWTKEDQKEGRGIKGQWARGSDGQLLKKRQYGNMGLKWFSAYLEFEDAVTGEEDLHRATQVLQGRLTDLAMRDLTDPYNAGLVYVSLLNPKKNTKIAELMGKQRPRLESKIKLDEKASMWMLKASDVDRYAAGDTVLTWKLNCWIEDILADWANLELYQTQCETLLFVTFAANRDGMKLDVKEARTQAAFFEQRATEIAAMVQDELRSTINLDSPKQLIEMVNSGILKTDWKGQMPHWWGVEDRATLGSYPDHAEIKSTGKEVLSKFENHPLARLILEYRKAAKGGATYVKNWIAYRDGNGIIHPQFNLTGTVAGRLSSSGWTGNWQNVPDRKGYTIKKCIVPPSSDWMIVTVDYGQLELRLGAWIAESLLNGDSGQLIMTRLFEEDRDMHSYTRDQINVRATVFGVMLPIDICRKLGYTVDNVLEHGARQALGDTAKDLKFAELMQLFDSQGFSRTEWTLKAAELMVADACRQIAKIMNFGLLYNGGKGMLSSLLALDVDTSDVLVKDWRGTYPAFPRANAHYQKLGLTWRAKPNSTDKAMYVTQPISGRHRRTDKYMQVKHYLDDQGVKQVMDEQKSEARKYFNNVVQGLGGYIANTSALRIAKAIPTSELRIFGIIHDALEMYVRKDCLHHLLTVKKIMTDWEVRPGLTVDFGYSETNWQDITKIKNLEKWVQERRHA
jgi:DNA polymerase I-like protein with 3'-5' exonuclease and polymerase domains